MHRKTHILCPEDGVCDLTHLRDRILQVSSLLHMLVKLAEEDVATQCLIPFSMRL